MTFLRFILELRRYSFDRRLLGSGHMYEICAINCIRDLVAEYCAKESVTSFWGDWRGFPDGMAQYALRTYEGLLRWDSKYTPGIKNIDSLDRAAIDLDNVYFHPDKTIRREKCADMARMFRFKLPDDVVVAMRLKILAEVER